MSTPNYVVVSLGGKELTTEGGITIKGIHKRFLSIKLICGFIVLSGILLNGVEMQPIPVQFSLDGENKFHISNVYGYDLVVDNTDLVEATETKSGGTKLYRHRISIDGNYLIELVNNKPTPIAIESGVSFYDRVKESEYLSLYLLDYVGNPYPTVKLVMYLGDNIIHYIDYDGTSTTLESSYDSVVDTVTEL